MFLSSVHFFYNLAQRVSKFKSKMIHSFHRGKDLDDDFAGTSTYYSHSRHFNDILSFFQLSCVAALVQIVDVCPLFTIALYAVLICSQDISGKDDFVIAMGSSDTEDVQIKIWTPMEVIIIAVVILKLVLFHMYYQEILPVSSPCVVQQGGISFRQMLIMVLICVMVQALLIYTPMQKVAELISKVPTLIVMVPMSLQSPIFGYL